MTAKVGQVEDILLKAGSAESYRTLEEFGPDPGIGSDGPGYLVDVGPGRLAKGRDCIDAGNALGQKSVGGELRELGRPQIGRQDLLGRHPPPVDIREVLDGGVALRRRRPADEDAVGLEEVLDRGALREELRVGEDLEVGARARGGHHARHRIGRLDGDGRLLDDDLRRLAVHRVAHGGDAPRRELLRL